MILIRVRTRAVCILSFRFELDYHAVRLFSGGSDLSMRWVAWIFDAIVVEPVPSDQKFWYWWVAGRREARLWIYWRRCNHVITYLHVSSAWPLKLIPDGRTHSLKPLPPCLRVKRAHSVRKTAPLFESRLKL